jgi:hypothetical protein
VTRLLSTPGLSRPQSGWQSGIPRSGRLNSLPLFSPHVRFLVNPLLVTKRWAVIKLVLSNRLPCVKCAYMRTGTFGIVRW